MTGGCNILTFIIINDHIFQIKKLKFVYSPVLKMSSLLNWISGFYISTSGADPEKCFFVKQVSICTGLRAWKMPEDRAPSGDKAVEHSHLFTATGEQFWSDLLSLSPLRAPKVGLEALAGCKPCLIILNSPMPSALPGMGYALWTFPGHLTRTRDPAAIQERSVNRPA